MTYNEIWYILLVQFLSINKIYYERTLVYSLETNLFRLIIIKLYIYMVDNFYYTF